MLQLLLQKCKSRLSGKDGAIMIQQAAQISTLAKSRALFASAAVVNLLLCIVPAAQLLFRAGPVPGRIRSQRRAAVPQSILDRGGLGVL